MNPKEIKKNWRLKQIVRRYGQAPDNFKDLTLDNRTLIINEEIGKHNQGGVFMQIKFKEFEEFKRGTYDMISVKGTALTGKRTGEDYKCDFFKTQKEMFVVIEGASAGDTLNITLKKNGNWWNPTAIINEGITEQAISEDKPSTGSGPGFNKKVESVKISSHVTAACVAAGVTDDDDIGECLMQTLKNASMVEDFFDKKGPFAFDGAESHDIPEDGMNEEKTEKKPQSDEEIPF